MGSGVPSVKVVATDILVAEGTIEFLVPDAAGVVAFVVGVVEGVTICARAKQPKNPNDSWMTLATDRVRALPLTPALIVKLYGVDKTTSEPNSVRHFPFVGTSVLIAYDSKTTEGPLAVEFPGKLVVVARRLS